MDRNAKSNTLFDPTILKVPESMGNLVQVSVHSVMSKSFIRETTYVFPEQNLENLIVIHTMQHARLNMVSFGEDVENEKDRLIKSFFRLATYIHDSLKSNGSYWIDYIDPCSGLPMCSEGHNMFNEVECAQTLLGYRIMNVGCCKIILHPQWGSSVYPASIFTTAPSKVVLEVLSRLERGSVEEAEQSGDQNMSQDAS